MDANQARTANIRIQVSAAGGPAEWARRFGGARWTANQAQQWISESSPKGIGQKLARELEMAMSLPPAALDRPPGSTPATLAEASQSAGLDAPTLSRTLDFLSDLFAAHGKAFRAGDHVGLVTAVYNELVREPGVNVVQLSVKYGKTLEGGDAGSGADAGVVEHGRGSNQRGAGKAKAAAGRKG